jgi:hypothetical protein
LTGYCTPEIYKNELKEPGPFILTQTIDSSEEGELKKLYKKTYILQIFFEVLKRKHSNKNKDFFDLLDSHFSDQASDLQSSRNTLGLETALRFSFGMLSELKALSPGILQKALEGVYSSLLSTQEGSLFITEFSGFSIDELLTNCRVFLQDLAQDTKQKEEIRCLAIKNILLIGRARSSAEDLLIAYSILKTS